MPEMPVENRGSEDRVRALLTSGKMFLTLAGVETDLMFRLQFPLRSFAAFEVFADRDAHQRLIDAHLKPIAQSAREHGYGLLVDCLVYKAHADVIREIGYNEDDVARLNRESVAHTRRSIDDWRAETGTDESKLSVLLAGDIGPRGDGYGLREDEPVSAEASLAYHRTQVVALAEAGVDVLIAWTQTNCNEAIGITRAARDAGLPVILSATVETDGRLPDGTALGEFVTRVDEATETYPVFFMVNCAHPEHIEGTLRAAAAATEPWLSRFRGLRANASCKSHAELDDSTTLDRGDPVDLGVRMARMAGEHSLCLVGGCCGTDPEHLAEIAAACATSDHD
jgi:homocysteine S-methyltransferase